MWRGTHEATEKARSYGRALIMSVPPKIFLSYASEDAYWVDKFTDMKWFTSQIGAVEIQKYLAADNVDFGGIAAWVSKQVDGASVVIAFISEFYRKKQWTKVELGEALTAYQRKRLVFVPIMMDSAALAWWAELRKKGDLFALPRDYAYNEFIGSEGFRVKIDGDDEVQGKIARLARAIKAALAPPVVPPPDPAPVDLQVCQVCVLGHPSNRLTEELTMQADALADSARADALFVHRWKDNWLNNPSARIEPCLATGPSTLFVQPLAPGEASEQAADRSRTGKRLEKVGIQSPPVILWLPPAHSDPEFEAAAAAPTETLPDISVLREVPALRTDSPRELSSRLRAMLIPTRADDAPVLQIETVGSPPGAKPDLEAARLSQEIMQLFGAIVNSVVQTDSTSPWPFWADQFKLQIGLIPGSRAIVAVHDLDVPRSADKLTRRKRIETKFQQMLEYVRQSEASSKLNFFWAVLVYNNQEVLPFGQYPWDGRYKDWRVLSFERPDCGCQVKQPLRPDAASLSVFRTLLFQWALQ
jgi:hypothetical protein